MKQRVVDMLNGSVLSGLIRYALPLIATGVLQLLYNAADIIVVARWAGGTALAAVGCTGSLVALIISVFMGLSVGASVVVSRAFGAGDREEVHRAVHCAVALSVVSGVAIMAVGLPICRQALLWMGTPGDVIDQATLYLRIYLGGMPAIMVYNFGSAILRAVGDTKRPLYILILSGLCNVGLNLFLVIVLHWDVAGVAVATTVSQALSAVMVLICLMRAESSYRYEPRKTRFYKAPFFQMLRYGLPAGMQSLVFSSSNTLIQSSINSFGSAAMSGGSAAANLEGFVYTSMNSVYHTCMTFTAQNVGAGKIKRLPRIFFFSLLLVSVVGIGLSAVVIGFRESLLGFYTAASGIQTSVSSEEILHYGMIRLFIVVVPYFLCGIMEVLTGMMRGMGSPWLPMAVSVAGVCGIRIVWIFTVFRLWMPTLTGLYLSYPISWLFTGSVHAVCCFVTYRKLTRTTAP